MKSVIYKGVMAVQLMNVHNTTDAHLKMVEMVNVMLCIFYHSKKISLRAPLLEIAWQSSG